MMSDKQDRREKDNGFVLVVVIWLAGLLAITAATYAHTVQTHVRIASNLTESARAEALADGGAMLAVRDLLTQYTSSSTNRRFAIDATPVSCQISGYGRLKIRVHEEGAKIDINSAGLPLMETILLGLGEAPAFASAKASAIMDYRDPDDTRRVNGAETPEYIQAGRSTGPKNARFEAISELGQVLGVDSATIAKLRPHVTVHSGLAGIDPRVASAELIQLLRQGMERTTISFASFPELSATSSLPAMFTVASQRKTFTLHVVATTESGGVFVREAVVDLGPRRAPRHRFLTWRRGELSTSRSVLIKNRSPLSPC